jgi:hypothetical protein
MSLRLMIVEARASLAELGVVRATCTMGPFPYFLSLLLESSYSPNTCFQGQIPGMPDEMANKTL